MIIGIKRRVDKLGRIVLPIELRKAFNINKNDELEIIATEIGILLKIPDIEIKKKQENQK